MGEKKGLRDSNRVFRMPTWVVYLICNHIEVCSKLISEFN